jgi:hypothetical protein
MREQRGRLQVWTRDDGGDGMSSVRMGTIADGMDQKWPRLNPEYTTPSPVRASYRADH